MGCAAPGKAVLTALDFIGQHRREFRFDIRYRPLTGSTRKGLERQIETGFPFLPSGSQLILDRVAADRPRQRPPATEVEPQATRR